MKWALPLLLLTSLVNAQKTEFRFTDFSGGLNDTVEAQSIAINESPDMCNVVIDEPGKLKPRNGFTLCGVVPSGNPATNLYEFSPNSGARRLIVTDNDQIWETPDCTNFTRIRHDLGTDAKPYFATVRDKLWIVNKATHPFTWDGSTGTILDGGAGTPSPPPPNCQYLEFFQERVWCARESGDPSAIAFSAITDPSGNDLDPSTGTAAWPATNVVYVDQDSGGPVYAIKKFKNALYAFKERSIFRITCRVQCEFDIEVVRTPASAGTKFQEGIVALNDRLYYVGHDGIYVFDGENSVRLSDKFQKTFEGILQPGFQDIAFIWNTQEDFDTGTTTNTLTSHVEDTLTLSSRTVVADTKHNGEFSNSSSWTLTTQGFGAVGCLASISISGGVLHMGLPLHLDVDCTEVVTSVQQYVSVKDAAGTTIFFESFSDGENVLDISAQGADELRLQFLVQAFGPSGFRFEEAKAISDVGYRFRPIDGKLTFTATRSGTVGVTGLSYTIDNIRVEQFVDRGTFTSNTFNTVEVSTWSTFESDNSLNAGTVDFEIRFGANASALAAASWSSITPGTKISNNTTDLLGQWRAIFEKPSTVVNSPEVDSVTVNFFRGDVAENPISGMAWKNRVWLSMFDTKSSTSITNTQNNLVLIKSRLADDVWMPNDLKITAMTPYLNNFYAAASTHSAIYIMDDGGNDNGEEFVWYWKSREENFEQPFRNKRLMELHLDYREANAPNFTYEWLRGGTTDFWFVQSNLNSVPRNSKRFFVDGGYGQTFQFKVGADSLDESVEINALGGMVSIQKTMR